VLCMTKFSQNMAGWLREFTLDSERNIDEKGSLRG
jgi:hypothetical protein